MKSLSNFLAICLLVICLLQACRTKTTGWQAYDTVTKDYRQLPKKVRNEINKNFVQITGGAYSSGIVSGSDTFSVLISEKRVAIYFTSETSSPSINDTEKGLTLWLKNVYL
jgi:hypothetical protein